MSGLIRDFFKESVKQLSLTVPLPKVVEPTPKGFSSITFGKKNVITLNFGEFNFKSIHIGGYNQICYFPWVGKRCKFGKC